MRTDEMTNKYDIERLKEAVCIDIDVVTRVLGSLTPREELVLRSRLGLGREKPKSLLEIAAENDWGSYQEIVRIERRALKKLGHPARRRHLLGVFLEPTIDLSESIESLKRITPDLMRHLQREHSDIEKVPPRVFEHIIAEILAGHGWNEVKLVGSSSATSADILAGYYIPSTGMQVRVFLEVKRWKDRVGVEVFNSVLGAMVSERDVFGWHMAWIIALGGASETRKFNREEWSLKGVEVKDKKDILRWLEGYRPNPNGLWLPPDAFEGA